MSAPGDYVFLDLPAEALDAPVVFLFHGTGGDETQFLDLAGHLLPGARRIGVRGDVSENGALRYFRRFAEGQFDLDDLARATRKMIGFIEARIGPRRPAQVIGFGYSNGANILASVQFAAPELFDTAILLHPMIPFEPAPQPGLEGRRVLLTAGRRDPICPPAATERLINWYGAQGADVTAFWHEGGHEIRQEELIAIRDYLRR